MPRFNALIIALCIAPVVLGAQIRTAPIHTLVTGRVVDADAHPVEGADIQIQAGALGPVAVARSDDHGEYRASVAGVADSVTIRVRRLGMQPTVLRLPRHAGIESLAVDVQLVALEGTLVASVR